MNSSIFDKVPNEILFLAFSYNNEGEKHILSMVSHKMKEISDDQSLWEESAKNKGKTSEIIDNKSFVRTYIKKYNLLICQYFPGIAKGINDPFFAKEAIDLKIKDKGKVLTTNLDSFIMAKESLEYVKMLIDAGARPTAETLSNCVISKSSTTTIKVLITAGARPNASTLNFAAIFRASAEVIKILKDAGAQPEEYTKTLAENVNGSRETINMLTIND